MKTSVKSNYRTATTKYTTSIRSVQSGHNDVHTADDFAVHFRSKVDLIRMSTSGAPPPQIICRPCASLSVLRHVTAAEITKIVVQAPMKHCSLDPDPTSLVKSLLPLLADTMANMVNASFREGVFPATLKHAIVRQRLKKTDAQSR